MIDTHCHLTYDPLLHQLDAVLARAAESGVDRMITVGTRPDDAQKAAGLAAKHANIYAAVGLHPHYCAEHQNQVALITAMQQIATMPKVVALGEMGLDRHYHEPPIEVQRKAFAWQLGLAAEMTLPIIIHNREATPETCAVIRDSSIPGGRFVFHCFTGNDAELDQILDLGAMVSFTGIVTFKNSATLAASAKRVPLDRVMIETDAPYLTPAPYRKVKVNEPAYVRHTAQFLADQRGMSLEDFTRVTDANAERFFRLPKAS
jgi:TatD DNase family protein